MPNPEEGDHFQGDIIITDEQLEQVRNGIIGESYRWPIVDGVVTVPYEFKTGTNSFCKYNQRSIVPE